MRLSLNRWFQRDDLFYVKIQYDRNTIYFAVQTKEMANKWIDYIKQAVGYFKYIAGKLDGYMGRREDEKA